MALSIQCELQSIKNFKWFHLESAQDVDVITIHELNEAFGRIRPSNMRQIYTEVPKVFWNDIGGQQELKEQLRQAIEWPLKHAEAFRRLGISPPKGVLMYGPPGCSKTMVAKAIATESGLNFLSVKGPELFSKWVGESERAVREVFSKARQVAPSIIFFDEIDALGSHRSEGSEKSGGSNVADRVLTQILTEMDGIQSLNNVLIVAATNRPDVIDRALLRPGRLDRMVYVPLPDIETRKAILQIRFRHTPVDTDVDLEFLATETKGYSGAELVALCTEAALSAMQESIECRRVSKNHFLAALKKVKPRTDVKCLKIYDNFQKSVLD
uniref:AAA+ ATPase domain-containing protein n=1 Tax=Romanomermis culicivorax TaxID=13658 RepID=A0A915J0A0_ROMCU